MIDSVEQLSFELPGGEALVGIAGLPFPFVVVSYWVRSNPNEPARGRSRVRLQVPGADDLVIGEPAEVDLRNFERLRAKMHLQAIPYRGAGRYLFCVEKDTGEAWEVVAQVPLDVVQRMEAASAAAAGGG